MSELKQEQNFAAEQLQDAIEADETGAPKANVESDYSRSKEFSTPAGGSDSGKFDSMNQGSAFSKSEESEGSESGNPEAFRDMAQEVTPNSKE
jgi:hypothetical protein